MIILAWIESGAEEDSRQGSSLIEKNEAAGIKALDQGSDILIDTFKQENKIIIIKFTRLDKLVENKITFHDFAAIRNLPIARQYLVQFNKETFCKLDKVTVRLFVFDEIDIEKFEIKFLEEIESLAISRLGLGFNAFVNSKSELIFS